MWHAPHPLAHPLLRRVCCCHPYCITHYCPGCVAATPIAFTLQGVLLPPLLHYTLLSRVCRCHPYCIHFAGCVAATLYYVRVHPTTIVPFTAKQLCSSVVFILRAFLSNKVVNMNIIIQLNLHSRLPLYNI